MKDEVEELWFKPYDEDSYLKSFCEVDYEKYLLVVVTDPNFQWFNSHAHEKKRYWDSGSLVFFELLEMLDQFFNLDTLDERLMYVEDPAARKLPVKFKFWVDTERLYCLLFLGLDDILFNEERLLSSMIRLKRALLALFEIYKPSMFEQGQFTKFMFNLKQQVLTLQKTFNQRKENLVSLTKEIVAILVRVSRGEKVAEREVENELFRRISKEIMHFNMEKVKGIEERLFNATVVPKQVDIKEEKEVWKMPSLTKMVTQAKSYYDPTRLEEEEREKQEMEDKLVRRKNFLEVAMMKDPDSKSKSIDKRDKMSTRTRFNLHRLLGRTGNYPYNFKNILYNDFHDDLVRIKDENKKEQSRDSDMENDLLSTYYEEEFMNRLRKAGRDYAKVSKADIVEVMAEQRYLKQGAQKTSVADIQWIDLEEISSTQRKYSTTENDSFQHKSMQFNDSDDQENHHGDSMQTELAEQSTFKYYVEALRKEQIQDTRKFQQSRQHFNVYQSKHSRDTKGWGIIRSLYNELKVKRKMKSFLKETMKYYYYINRLDVQQKRKEVH